MYQPNDERACILGLPTGHWKKSGQGQAEAWDHNSVSKVGGYAIWNDPDSAPADSSSLLCGNCGSAEEVQLVSQIYAPIETDRSLYVFCCNRRVCSLTSKGWLVIRNQISSLKQNEISALPAEVTTTPIPVVETATPKKSSVWDFLNETDDTSQNNEDDDLLALLANRNTNLGSAKKSAAVEQKSPKPSTAVAATAGKQPCLITKKAFPVCQLKEEEEYCDIAIDGEDGEVYGDEVDQSHIESLLSSYLKDEDDTENLLALQTHGIGAGATVRPVTHSQDDDQEEDEEEEIEVKSGKGQKKVDDDFAEDKLTMESKKHKIEFYFQRRASLYPNQILRYAYDGIPLWITSPSPLEEEEARIKKSNNKASNALIPDCECCGASRVFECQLMPALLSLMSKHMPKSSNDAKAKTANGDQRSRPDVNEILGDSMDFGVVTVWSCRNSCEPINNQYQREVVIVQPPSDLI